MVLRTSDYDYELPDRLIARYPPVERSGARMLVLHRHSRQIEHRTFAEFPYFVRPNDLAVLNDTRVLPARVAARTAHGGAVELLVIERSESNRWICLVQPGRKARVGARLYVGEVCGTVETVLPGEDGQRVVVFDESIDLDVHGTLPLPPYFRREAEASDRVRYQTVFGRQPGAVAAPTAGLHFTSEILARVRHALVTLHVGIGTFKPVKAEDLTAHRMHTERFEITADAASTINSTRAAGGRIVAVGTTTVRVLEGCRRDERDKIVPQRGETDIFIHPPKTAPHIDALLTNFHLPRSTLLMLVSSVAGSREWVLEAYGEAIAREYRFYSYGDCMLITD